MSITHDDEHTSYSEMMPWRCPSLTCRAHTRARGGWGVAAIVSAGLRVRRVRGGAHEAGQDVQPMGFIMDAFDAEPNEADEPPESSRSSLSPSPSSSDSTPTAQHGATRSESTSVWVPTSA